MNFFSFFFFFFCADFLFQEAFLTTYRTFVTPTELIHKLMYRYNKFIGQVELGQRPARNAFALLVRVVDDLGVSDCDEPLLRTLLAFIYALLGRGDLALAKVLRCKVLEKFEARRTANALMAGLNNSLNNSRNDVGTLSGSGNVSHVSTHQRTFSLLDFKSAELAEQMTLFDNELFVKIEPAELLHWAREQKEEQIPNLNKFTEHFNKMSYWTRSRLVEQSDAKERERLFAKFLKVMKHLRKLNNYNSYLALLSALDSAPIRRLEWSRHLVDVLNEYSALIDSSSSFRAYRQALDETQPPSIPYIGLILQDLTFVHIGNNDFLPDGKVNFAKRWQIFYILDQLRKFRHSHYNLKRNDAVFNFFDNFDSYLCEETIWQMSQQIKPRPNTKK